ncbi:MAG: hypothetical protein L6416_08585 [Candidatus Omnitrophica bacterium]|nr:hypothetical protein [Candidatus Omnitrophota bacterium]
MRLKNILVLAVITTCICLGYVKQQVEVVKLSYSLMNKEKRLCDLIDYNRILLYNNSSLKAPQYLTGMIEQNELKLSLPDTASVAKVRVKRGKPVQLAKSTASSWKTRLLDVFVPKAQAAPDLSR